MKKTIVLWLQVGLSSLFIVVLAGGCSLLGGKPSATVQCDDRALEANIAAALAKDPTLEASTISVQSCNGVVELTGAVATLADKERAGLLAASVPDVAQVKNDVSVRAATNR